MCSIPICIFVKRDLSRLLLVHVDTMGKLHKNCIMITQSWYNLTEVNNIMMGVKSSPFNPLVGLVAI